MTIYFQLDPLLRSLGPTPSSHDWERQVIPYLVRQWLDDYCRTAAGTKNIVEATVSNFSYLFDIDQSASLRLGGVSRGKHSEARDPARMAGHPLSADGEASIACELNIQAQTTLNVAWAINARETRGKKPSRLPISCVRSIIESGGQVLSHQVLSHNGGRGNETGVGF